MLVRPYRPETPGNLRDSETPRRAVVSRFVDLKSEIHRFLLRFDACNRHLLVACSGGPDSAAMSHAVSELAREGNVLSAELLHVDHGLRPESQDDAARVRELGARLGLPVAVEIVSVPTKGSLEAAARDVRYEAFERVAHNRGDAFVLTGHTASDQSETLLMRMVRGTGLQGLGGIPRKRGRYLRPLLSCTREEILDYIQHTGLEILNDSMNEDERFYRVRVRKRWMPMLCSENPKIHEAMGRLAEEARSHDSAVLYGARVLLERARVEEALDVSTLLQAPAAVRRRAVCLWLEPFGIAPVDSAHWRDIEKLLEPPLKGSATLCLSGGRICREYGQLVVNAPFSTQPEISVAGLAEPFSVRSWQPGDRMKPQRLRGRSKKLSDLFVDAKVPRRLRTEARVVINHSGEIDWAEHVGLAFLADCEVNLTTSTSVAINKH